MNKLQPIKPLLSSIPAVHEIQKISEVQNLINIHGHNLVTQAIRTTQTEFRELLLSSGTSKNIQLLQSILILYSHQVILIQH